MNRLGSDKEVAAVTYNIRQQRILEKTMNTLSLEASYSLKLLDLNHRIIKVNYRRLKDRVCRINSFLTPKEIRELAELEASGKLNPTYSPSTVTSCLTIASAEKRLKLNPNRPKTSASCRRDHDKMVDFLDLTNPTSVKNQKNETPLYVQGQVRPMTAVCATGAESPRTFAEKKHRAKTAPLNKTRKSYDSHENTGTEVRTLNNAISATPRPRSTSVLSRSSVDSLSGENQYKERKDEMLKLEAQKGAELDGKKRCFLKKVGDYVESNPPRYSANGTASTNFPQSLALDPTKSAEAPTISGRNKRSRRRLKGVFDGISSLEYERKVKDSWKDLAKCRYLRIPNDQQDLTGYNTLVTDQLKLLNVFRKKSQTSFLNKLQS